MTENELVPELRGFDDIKHIDEDGQEYWFARELAGLLGYKLWQNFERVINEAIKVVEREGPEAVASNVEEVFIDSNKNSKGGRPKTDYRLSRHACYIIAESADGRKDEVAWAKIYFAYTTRRFELLAETEEDRLRIEHRQRILLHNSEMQMRLKQSGAITAKQFATFFNRGYQELYGGETAEDIRVRKGLPPRTDILDWMGEVESAANGMRAALTLHRMKKEPDLTLNQANDTHYDMGKRVRDFLATVDVVPEELPSPKKSYQQLLREQAVRERLAAEDRSGLWGLLSDDFSR